MEINFPNNCNIGEGFDYLFETLEEKEFSFNGKVTIDLFNLDISQEYNELLAKLIYKYNCELLGISTDRLNIINSIINTGYFIKEKLTDSDYFDFFKNLLESIDFDFIILDNIYYNSKQKLSNKKIDLIVAQPMYFDNKYLYYKTLKVGYTQPKDLEKALNMGNTIWDYRSINKHDLSNSMTGFRLASNNLERQYLDLYKQIISKRLKNFI